MYTLLNTCLVYFKYIYALSTYVRVGGGSRDGDAGAGAPAAGAEVARRGGGAYGLHPSRLRLDVRERGSRGQRATCGQRFDRQVGAPHLQRAQQRGRVHPRDGLLRPARLHPLDPLGDAPPARLHPCGRRDAPPYVRVGR